MMSQFEPTDPDYHAEHAEHDEHAEHSDWLSQRLDFLASNHDQDLAMLDCDGLLLGEYPEDPDAPPPDDTEYRIRYNWDL